MKINNDCNRLLQGLLLLCSQRKSVSVIRVISDVIPLCMVNVLINAHSLVFGGSRGEQIYFPVSSASNKSLVIPPANEVQGGI